MTPKIISNKKIISRLAVVGILVGGLVITIVLTALRTEPPRTERVNQAPLVSTLEVSARSGALTVTGTGSVQPTREVTLAAEVGGKVATVSPALVSGGTVTKGHVLATLVADDYENALAMAQSEVVQRRYELIRGQQEVEVAREEWANSGASGEPETTELGRLAYREPELELARAGLATAEARVRDAELRLERTRLRAPFDGKVRSKQIDVGQFVGPGQPVAVIYATDEVELVVPLSPEQMDLLDPNWQLPDRLAARVMPAAGTSDAAWDGYVHRVEGALDPASRLINVVVRVPGPYRPSENQKPLLIGTFARVGIAGRVEERVWTIPLAALRDQGGQSAVWIVEDSTLQVQRVDVVQLVDDTAIIRAANLPATITLITSDPGVVTPGMVVRLAPYSPQPESPQTRVPQP